MEKNPLLRLELSLSPGSLFLSGGGVEKWQSFTPLRHQFNQATDASKPLLQYDGLFFDGSNDYLTTSDSPDWFFSNFNWTMEAWIKKNTNSAIYHSVAGQANSTQAELTLAWLWRITSANTVELYFKSNGVNVDWQSTGTIADLLWHHVVITRHNNTGYIYIDGKVDATTFNFTGQTMHDGVDNVSVGRVGDYNGNYMNGWITDLRIYHSCIYPSGLPFIPPQRSQLGLPIAPTLPPIVLVTALVNQFETGD